MIWINVIAAVSVCGAIWYDVLHNVEKKNRTMCEECKHLETIGRGAWKYYCDKEGGFDRKPKYCREFKPRKNQEEKL